MMDSTKRWYAVYTKSRTEKRVNELIKIQEIEVYLPLVKTLKQWSDRKKMIEEPLFKSYIFVFINQSNYLKVLNTPGVVCFVTIGNEKIAIPEVQITAVKTYLGEIELDNTINFFKEGDEVEILFGALKGLKGKLIQARNQRKLVVQIDAINLNITITLPANLIQSADRTAVAV